MSDPVNDEKTAAINAVSPSFCLAKWMQVTIDLVHGTTQSCHHPRRREIPLNELEKNPSALHNTRFKKEQRRKMLEGERPSECSYCWAIEDASPHLVSDRIVKSSDPWAYPALERIRKLPWDYDVLPTYVEVMLDDRCNFSCMYCISDVSRSIATEMKQFGPYDVKHADHRMPFFEKPEREDVFVEAFWKWLPDLLPGLQVLRITGGEPLLSPQFAKLMDRLSEGQQPGLTLVVNSHLGHAPDRMGTFFETISRLRAGGHIGGFELYTSVDAQGERAEYIRHGLKYEQLLSNVALISERMPGTTVVLMTTFNLLSIGSFSALVDDVLRLKEKNPGVILDISYLRDPEYLGADLASAEMLAEMARVHAKMKSFEGRGLSVHEIRKMENVLTWAARAQDPELVAQRRRDFFSFVQEYDRRKKRSFLQTFPDYRDFYILCKMAAFASLRDGTS